MNWTAISEPPITADTEPMPTPRLYLEVSKEPLQILFFLLPLLALYEVGTRLLMKGTEVPAVLAQAWVRQSLIDVLEWFPVWFTADWIPPVALVAVLLSLFWLSEDPIRFNPSLYFGMGCETMALATPLLIFSLAYWGWPVPLRDLPAEAWRWDLMFSIGAGVYEELVFRLLLIGPICYIFISILKSDSNAVEAVAVTLSAMLFAAYHFTAEVFEWPRFLFYAIGGVYLGYVYLCRGFGIAAATHALYNMVIVLFRYGGSVEQFQ